MGALTDEEKKWHRKQAVDLFNGVWDMMEMPHRTAEESDRMIHAAHASRYHWELVGTPLNLARGEWQVSRAYAVAGRVEPCMYHAQRCLDICQAHGFGDFDLAYAYEALARAAKIAGDDALHQANYRLAAEAGKLIAEKGDREQFEKDMASL